MKNKHVWAGAFVCITMLAAVFVPVGKAADQWWDPSTTAGLQGGVTNWDAGTTPAWAPTSAGTTTPGLWTDGNNAWFAGGGLASTAIVNGATAGWILLNAAPVMFQAGSVPLTLNNGVTVYNSSVNPHGGSASWAGGTSYFYSDVNLTNNVAFHIANYTMVATGRITGAYTVTKCGSSGLTLSNSASSFAGLVFENGTISAFNGGNVLGGGPLTIGSVVQPYEYASAGFFASPQLTLNSPPVAGVPLTTTVGTVTANGSGQITLNANANCTNILSAGALTRSGRGTLSFIGTPWGGQKQVYFSAGTTLVNGALPLWLTDVTSGGGAPEFFTYTPTGIVVYAYATSFTPSITTQIVSVGNATLGANQACYALKLSGTLNLGNQNLTLGNGTSAGLNLYNAAITNGTLDIGTSELFATLSQSSGVIAVPMSGTGPLTVSAKATGYPLTLSNSTLYAGGPITVWTPAALTLVPTADVTMSNTVYLGPSSVNLTKNGPYAVTLAGSSFAGINGTVQVNGGQLIFSGATSTNNGTLNVIGTGTTVSLTNGAQVLGPVTVNVGTTAGNAGCQLIVNTNGVLGSTSNTSAWVVGGVSTNNQMIVNSAKLNSGALSIGNGSSAISNTVSISGSTWNMGALTIANGSGAFGNSMTIANSQITNSSAMNVGAVAGANFNSLTITNATMVASANNYIGNTGTSNNTLSIQSGGTLNLAPSSSIKIGGGVAASFNSATINGGTLYGGSITVGGASGCVSNRLDVSNGTIGMPTPGQGSFQVGSASAAGNMATLVNSTMTAAGGGIGMGIGGSGAYSNTLFADNSVLTNFSTFTIAGNGSTLTLTNNAKLFVTTSASSASSTIGSTGTDSNNTVYVLAGCIYSDLSGSGNQNGISHNGGFNNRVVINGGTYVNVSAQGMAGSYSGVTITNGLFTAPGLCVGYTPSSVPGSALCGTNDFFNMFNGGIANLLNFTLTVGYNTGMVNSVTINGGSFTNVGAVNVGNYAGACSNSVTMAGGSLGSAGAVSIGAAVGANTNYVLVSGASALWNGGGQTFTIGSVSSTGNYVTITQGGTVDNIGTLTVVTNHFLNLLGGTLGLSNTVYANGIFMVGDGSQSAKLKNLGGVNAFNGGLLIASNASLSGIGSVHGGSVGLTLTNGAMIDPGFTGVGQLNVGAGILNWCGGVRYLVNISDFQSGPGVGWDLLNVNTQINLVAGGPALTVKLDSMGVNAANFSTNSDYNLRIATASSNLVGFSGVTFTIDTSSFSNTFTGTWGITNIGTSLYLTYRGATSSSADYTWVSPNNGNWSVGGNWAGSSAPANNNPALVVKFPAGSADAAYSATNDLGTFQLNQLQLASSSAVTNRILGNKLQFQNTGAGLNQFGGAFVISNPVELAVSTRFWGSGLGTVTLASNVTGAGSLTKEGSWTLALANSNSFAGPVVVNSADGQLRLDNANALGNSSVTVSNGTLLANFGAYTFGNSPVARTALVTGSGAMWTNNDVLTIGTNVVVTVANGGTLSPGPSKQFTVAGKGSVPVSLIVSNGGKVVTSTSAYIGQNTVNETVILTGGGVWNNPGQNIFFGSGASATNNVLRMEGGSATVNSGLQIGDTASCGNSLLISGSGLYTLNSVTLGNGGSCASNTMRIDNGATCTITSGNAIGIGNNALGYNTLIVTNGGSLIGGSITLGGGGISNAYLIDGSPGYSVISNGTIAVGNSGNYGRMTVANASIKSGAIQVGAVNNLGNSLAINSNVAWDVQQGSLTVGSVATVTVAPGATLTNLNGITLSGYQTTLALTNRNVFFFLNPTLNQTENLLIGNTANLGTNSLTLSVPRITSANGSSIVGNSSSSNTLTLVGNTVWISGGSSAITVGSGAGACGNRFNLNGGVQVTNFNSIVIGGGAGTTGNVMTVDGGGTPGGALASNYGILTVGSNNALQSSLIITNGGWVMTPNLLLGANATNCSVMLGGNGSLLSASLLTMGSNSVGNTFLLNGVNSTATVGQLVATNTTGLVNFYAGVFNVTTSSVNNGSAFVVGDGVQSATLNFLSGIGATNSFANGLVVTNGATLSGNGLIQATTTVYGTFNPGTTVAGAISNNGPFSLMSATTSRVDIVSTNGGPGVGWDFLMVTNGALTVNGTLMVVLAPGLSPTNQSFVIMTNSTGILNGPAWNGGTATAYCSTNLQSAVGTFNVGVGNNGVILNGYDPRIRHRGALVIIM